MNKYICIYEYVYIYIYTNVCIYISLLHVCFDFRGKYLTYSGTNIANPTVCLLTPILVYVCVLQVLYSTSEI